MGVHQKLKMPWQKSVSRKNPNVSKKNPMHRCKIRQPKMHTRAIGRMKHALRKGVRRVTAKAKAKQTQPGRVIPNSE